MPFLVSFLCGTVIAMAGYTCFIGVGTGRLSRSAPNMTRRISLASSALALLLGVWFVFEGGLAVRALA